MKKILNHAIRFMNIILGELLKQIVLLKILKIAWFP